MISAPVIFRSYPGGVKLTHLLKQGPSLFKRGRSGIGHVGGKRWYFSLDLLALLWNREGAPALAGGVEFYSFTRVNSYRFSQVLKF